MMLLTWSQMILLAVSETCCSVSRVVAQEGITGNHGHHGYCNSYVHGINQNRSGYFEPRGGDDESCANVDDGLGEVRLQGITVGPTGWWGTPQREPPPTTHLYHSLDVPPPWDGCLSWKWWFVMGSSAVEDLVYDSYMVQWTRCNTGYRHNIPDTRQNLSGSGDVVSPATDVDGLGEAGT